MIRTEEWTPSKASLVAAAGAQQCSNYEVYNNYLSITPDDRDVRCCLAQCIPNGPRAVWSHSMPHRARPSTEKVGCQPQYVARQRMSISAPVSALPDEYLVKYRPNPWRCDKRLWDVAEFLFGTIENPARQLLVRVHRRSRNLRSKRN